MASTMSRPKSRGMRSGETHAPDAGTLAHRRQQFGKSALPRGILIGVHVLAEQLDFGVTQLRHPPRFRQHRIRSPAALLAAGKGHHAVGAELVAAFDDGDVAAVRVGARGELGFKAFVGLAVVEPSDALPCLDLHQHLRADCDTKPSRRPGKHAARARKSSRLPAGPRTPARRISCPASQLLVVGQAMKDLLLGFVADGAGVIEDQPGLFDRLHLAISLGESVPTTFSESWTFIWQPKVSR